MVQNVFADVYARIVDAARSDPAIADEMLADFDGTLQRRFGLEAPVSGRLERSGDGFRLLYGDQSLDLGDPRAVAPGELSDAELEFVAGGGDKPCVLPPAFLSLGR